MLLMCALSIAQESNSKFELYSVKGKLVKNVSYEADCEKTQAKEKAIIIEILLTDPKDIKIFGKKIYVATLCIEFPGIGYFDDKEYEVKIRDRQVFNWKIEVLNSELFTKNAQKKEWWLHDLPEKKISMKCASD